MHGTESVPHGFSVAFAEIMQLLFRGGGEGGGGSCSQPAQAGAAEEGLGPHSISADQVQLCVGEKDQGSED